MYFLFSGEGPADLGSCLPGPEISEGDHFLPGPMAMLAGQVVKARHGYDPLDTRHCGYLSESRINQRIDYLKENRKSLGLRGKKTGQETRYFFNNARAVARVAIEKQQSLGGEGVVVILFRDSDGTASSDRGLWADKRKSMLDGFAAEDFPRGVPMVPKPKSEAWILCALNQGNGQGCDGLENRSGNDRSPNNLKEELQARLGEPATREALGKLVESGAIRFDKIDMPSFKAFRDRLEEVI